ncbi:MMPL family transporter [Streptomyces niveus]|uniref:MMPL family transporter n=1 Tax=Streptomyces niveus TaxID=193462 RepID=UPI00386690B0|nr:MMPL family transporter [Streptomyces niveus]
MSTFLYRLGRFAYRRKWAVIGAWLAVLLTVAVAALGLIKPFSSSTTIPGTEAQRTLDVMEKEFPTGGTHATGKIVFRAPDGQTITAGKPAEAITVVTRDAGRAPGVAGVTAPSVQVGTVSADSRTGIAEITFDAEKADKILEATKQALERSAAEARAAGLTVELGGDAFGPKVTVLGPMEAVGILIALGILIFVFRTLRGAIIPVATALVGVAIGVLGLMAMTSVVTMDSTSIILAVMLGLAVGIDYALLIVSRHQTQVRHGMDPEESAGLATGTAGGAVVFAGATVVIALSALAVVNMPFLTVMGLGAALTVVVSVLIAVTLLPAVLGLMGKSIATSTVPVLRRSAERAQRRAGGGRPSVGQRWAAATARRRWLVVVTCVLGLGLMAAPAADLQLGLGGGPDPQSSAGRAQKLVDDGFGPGYSGTLIVLAQGESKTTTLATANDFATQVKDLQGVASVSPPVPAASGHAALVSITPSSGPESEATTNLLSEIRERRGGIEEQTGTDLNVTGSTAVNIDVANKLSGALPVYCLLVMGLALLLLMVVFRAVAVPLKAALGFLLSLGASLGALVAVFQWGWLSDLLGITQTGPVLSFLPMLLVGILFGLAMDYEVFLVSRMREEYKHGRPPTEAMVRGFGHSSQVVAAAALIMIAVFGSFIFAELQVIKGMGFALAIGVLLDAFVVRMTLVPAVMAILGHKAWWLPRFLHRWLPNVEIEGERLTHPGPAPHQPTALPPQHASAADATASLDAK